MLESIDNSYQHFIKDFQNIYQNPERVNNFLEENSDNIEKKIKKLFLSLNLDKNFCIYANGGFGRKEMFPSSDIDISIIEISKTKSFENLEKFISSLWDEGYQIGHSVRSINEIKKISKQDVKEFTSYLTRRPIGLRIYLFRNIEKIKITSATAKTVLIIKSFLSFTAFKISFACSETKI